MNKDQNLIFEAYTETLIEGWEAGTSKAPKGKSFDMSRGGAPSNVDAARDGSGGRYRKTRPPSAQSNKTHGEMEENIPEEEDMGLGPMVGRIMRLTGDLNNDMSGPKKVTIHIDGIPSDEEDEPKEDLEHKHEEETVYIQAGTPEEIDCGDDCECDDCGDDNENYDGELDMARVELLKANEPGGKAQRELGLLDVINPFDGVPTGMALGEYINPEMYDIQKFKDTLPEGSTIPEMVDTVVGGDDQASVTDYNNPGNLTDVGQRGATGETYGNNFAVFPNARAGITALENDLALKVGRSNKVEDIIGQYASGDPNVGNYIDFVTSKVGSTVDQNELNDLRDAVIRFENKPEIANQYLAMVADGGMIDKELTNLQNGLQNMYNGIPSVRRR